METAVNMLGVAIYTLVFVMVFETYDKDDPKRYARAIARFFTFTTTTYIIFALFKAITKYVML